MTSTGATASDPRRLGLFGLVSAATIATASLGLALNGAGVGTWSRNPSAWLVGMVLGGLIMMAGRRRILSVGAVAATLAALAASLFAPDQSGVHRWIDVGPLHVNIAALLLPVTLVSLATLNLAPSAFLALVAGIGVILVAQPDASQATAFLLASAVILVRRGTTPPALFCGLVGAAALATAAWLRADPLQPVAEVEGVFSLLAGVSIPLAAAAAIGLAATCLAPLAGQRQLDKAENPAAVALCVSFSVTAVMPFLGAIPVPLVGVAMSFPLGFWLGMALLCARKIDPSG